MAPQEAIDFLNTLTDDQREKVKLIIHECLFVGEDRPSQELFGKGYDRYDRREKTYQQWQSIADGSYQKWKNQP
jgi:hypothetical protein